MSMKACADLIVTQLQAMSSPAVPDAVTKVPMGHGNDRPRVSRGRTWINLEPVGQIRSDEPNASQRRGYRYTAHYWASRTDGNIGTTSDYVMDMMDGILDKLQHNTLVGYLRYGITVEEMESTLEGGDDDDSAYVVRVTFTAWRQT